MSNKDDKVLLAVARQARERAYAPYSQFRVGAALLARDGTIYPGCNIENASYGLTVCAERTAFAAALAHGARPGQFMHLAVLGDTASPIAPCGACRQVMLELGGPGLVVTQANMSGQVKHTTAGALLPGAFVLPHF